MRTMSPAVAIVRAQAEVSELFLRLGVELREAPRVCKVQNQLWIRSEEQLDEEHVAVGQGDGFRIEWWLSVELDDNRWVDVGVELAWHRDTWSVQGGIHGGPAGGLETLVELPILATPDGSAAITYLWEQAQAVLGHWDEALFRLDLAQCR
jgi:hypothetical protein